MAAAHTAPDEFLLVVAAILDGLPSSTSGAWADARERASQGRREEREE
jgi:hypothetical protein